MPFSPLVRVLYLPNNFIYFNRINLCVLLLDGLEGTAEAYVLYTIRPPCKSTLLFTLGLFPFLNQATNRAVLSLNKGHINCGSPHETEC